MSTSAHSYFSNSNTSQLPVPKLKLATSDKIGNYSTVNVQWVDKSTHTVGGEFKLASFPLIVANDLDIELLNSNSVYVEMQVYRRGRSPSGTGYPSADGAGYIAPSSWTGGANAIDGNWTRGGSHTSNLAASGLMPPRPNHYLVTSPNQVIPVWEYLHNRFTRAPVAYRDTSGNTQYIDMTIPLTGMNKYVNTPTNRFAYSSRYTPYYATFRYVFMNNDTGLFVSDQITKIMKITAYKNPFEIDSVASASIGRPCAIVDSNYNVDTMKAYIETKLP